MMTLFAAFLALPAPARAQTPSLGYVVKADADTVYLDFGRASGAAPGQAFTVFTEGEELIHPETKKSLGRVQNEVAQGQLKEVQEQFSVGTLKAPHGEVKAGQRAKLAPAAPAPPPVQVQSGKPGDVPLRAPRAKSPALDMSVTGMAVNAFQGPGSLQVALSDSKSVRLFPYPPSEVKPLAEFVHPGVAPRIISLESADLNGNGRAELFVSLYNETFTRFETLVLELEGSALKQLADIPWIVRSHQDGQGRRVLAAQQILEDSTFPYSGIYPLVYADGRYGPGKPAIKHKRVDFAYDFTTATLDGSPATLLLTNTNLLRVQFAKGYWKTREAYGQTPTRVRWQGKVIEFHPPIEVAYDSDKASVYLARNLSMLGALSEPFGFFNNSEIYRKSWNGVALADDWKAEIGGCASSLALVSLPTGARELAVAVTGTAGKSAIWIYDP